MTHEQRQTACELTCRSIRGVLGGLLVKLPSYLVALTKPSRVTPTALPSVLITRAKLKPHPRDPSRFLTVHGPYNHKRSVKMARRSQAVCQNRPISMMFWQTSSADISRHIISRHHHHRQGDCGLTATVLAVAMFVKNGGRLGLQLLFVDEPLTQPVHSWEGWNNKQSVRKGLKRCSRMKVS